MPKGKERGLYRRGNRWWICYASADHKTVRESVGPLELARKRLSEIHGKQEREKFEDITRRSKATFRELMKEYKEKEGKDFILKFENDYLGFFGGRKLITVGRADLFEFKDSLELRDKRYGGHLSSTSVNRAMAGLRRLFNFGMVRGLLDQNPFSQIPPKSGLFNSEAEKRNRFHKPSYTEQELEQIITLLPDKPYYLRGMTMCAYWSGCRAGELMNLKWADWDGANKITLPKTKSGVPQVVVIPDEMSAYLKDLSQNNENPYVFHREDGEPLKHHHYYTPFRRIIKKLGKPKGFCFHTIRHTTASHLRKKDVPLDTISVQLRHSDKRTTEDFYIDHDEVVQKEAIEKTAHLLHNLATDSKGREYVQ